VAEQEVIKHAGKLINTIKSKEHTLWHKVKEFFTEIFIIVFAVSLSIWFHSWSEHKSEQKQVKVFLLGLKHDIKEDITQTKIVIRSFKKYDTLYNYLSSFSKDIKPNKDSLDSAIALISYNSFLRPNKNRFNGFLSAGKFNNIESDSLAFEILYYYQEALSQVQSSEGGWGSYHNILQEYLLNNTKDPNDNFSYWEAFSTPKGKYLAKRLVPWNQIYERYNNLIENGERIIKLIDEEYPEENK
jgi:hypothetical protein